MTKAEMKANAEKAEMAEETTRTIDMTPTWEQAVNLFFVVLENGTEEGKKMAREEIVRLARIVDNLNNVGA